MESRQNISNTKLNVTRHVDIFPMVVPYSYRGNVQISVSNYTDEAYVIHQGAVVVILF